jgi:hypothetical protein
MKSGTAKVNCVCKHEYQDKEHGAGVRIANATQKATDKTVDVRCTVCGKIHTVNKERVK